MSLTIEDIEKMTEDAVKTTKEVPAHLILKQPKGYGFMPLPFKDNKEKEIVCDALRNQIFPSLNIDYYFGIFDSWYGHNPKKRPSEERNAEAVVILEFHKTGELKVLIKPYKRTESGNIIFTDRMTEKDMTEIYTMWNFYDKNIEANITKTFDFTGYNEGDDLSETKKTNNKN